MAISASFRALDGQGLLGLGGIRGLDQTPNLSGLLGNYYSASDVRSAALKRGLLDAGIALLSQKPRIGAPIGLGESLGDALKAGVDGAQQAKQDYLQNALMGYQMDRQAKQDSRADQEWQMKLDSWKASAEQKAALNEALKTLDPEMQAAAKADPETFFSEYSKHLIKSKFPDPADSGIYGTPLPMQGTDGGFGYGAMGKNGGSVAIPPPNGGKWLNPYETSQMKSEGTQTGKNTADVKFELPKAEMTVQSDLQKIDEVIKHPGLNAAVGTVQGGPLGNSIMGTINSDAADFLRRVEQLRGGSFLQAYQILKGGGQIANAEGAKAEMAIARLNTAVSEKDFKQALEDYKTAIQRGLAAMKAQVGQTSSPLQSGGWAVQEIQ